MSRISLPALMAAMNQVPGAAGRDYSALKALFYGASPMPLPVMRASLELFPGVMQQVYGMTEQSGVVSVLGHADLLQPAFEGGACAARDDRAAAAELHVDGGGIPAHKGRLGGLEAVARPGDPFAVVKVVGEKHAPRRRVSTVRAAAR